MIANKIAMIPISIYFTSKLESYKKEKSFDIHYSACPLYVPETALKAPDQDDQVL